MFSQWIKVKACNDIYVSVPSSPSFGILLSNKMVAYSVNKP